MKRSAPDGGYGFGAKCQYRRNIWATFRAKASAQGFARPDCHVMLMPSIEGKEIEVAMAAGFRQDKMHVVDGSAGIVADLKKRYRQINTYAVGRPPDGGVKAAAARIAAKGIRLRFANLDLCGPVSKNLSSELALFARARCLDDVAYVAVTMLRGREQQSASSYLEESFGAKLPSHQLKPSWARVFDGLSEFDVRRQLFIGGHLAAGGGGELIDLDITIPIRCETYRSTAGSQTMIWSIWQVVSNRYAREHGFLTDSRVKLTTAPVISDLALMKFTGVAH